jgi:hypothetical protein
VIDARTAALDGSLAAARERIYARGEVWRCRARPWEPEANVQICRIDVEPGVGEIYHVGISGVRVRNPGGRFETYSRIPHVPVLRSVLDGSCLDFRFTTILDSDYRRGYLAWRAAFDQGRAGVFSISIADILDEFQRTLRRAPLP